MAISDWNSSLSNKQVKANRSKALASFVCFAMTNSEIIEKRSITGYALATWNWISTKFSRQQHSASDQRSHPQHSDSELLISDHLVIEIGSLNSGQHGDDDQPINSDDGTRRSLLDSTQGDHVVKGFINDLGICYINAVLQSLLAINVLRNYFIQSVDEEYGPLHVSMRKLFLDTSVEADPDTRITGVLDAMPLYYIMCDKFPGFYKRDKRGGDSLIFLLDLVQLLFIEEGSSIKPHEASLLETMFGVQLKIEYYSYITWLNIHYHCTHQDSITFNFPINDDHGNVTIERCLEVYLKNMLLTSRIKLFDFLPIAKMDASRTSIITKAPQIIPFTFHCQFSSATKVEFTETLDLNPYMDFKCIDRDNTYQYKLVGLIESTHGDDHVVAYVKCTRTTGHGLWYHVDDSKVELVDVEKVLGCTPAMLFYERCQGSRN